jgi:hypothetical protein
MIIQEILKYRNQELVAGRNPTTVALTNEKMNQLEEWAERTGLIEDKTIAWDTFSPGKMIFGMRIIPANVRNDQQPEDKQ